MYTEDLSTETESKYLLPTNWAPSSFYRSIILSLNSLSLTCYGFEYTRIGSAKPHDPVSYLTEF